MKPSDFPELQQYKQEVRLRAESYRDDAALRRTAHDFMQDLIDRRYTYNFFWCGVPCIQSPQDIQIMQEIIWEVKPDCIVETGVAWGGSLMFSASMLCILEACSCIDNGLVIGIDIEIRPHNKKNILAHPLSSKIQLLEGSSIDSGIVAQVRELVRNKKRVLVCLDSNHTHAHVLEELRQYAPLVSVNSYCLVADTSIEDLRNAPQTERPWGAGNSPKSAVHEFLRENADFVIDYEPEHKLILTSNPDGILKRIK